MSSAHDDPSSRAVALHAEAQRAWPGVELDVDAFVAFVLARVEGTAWTEHAGELFLACACVRGDAEALRAFDERFLSAVPSIVQRAGSTAEEAREIAQNLRARLLLGEGGAAPRIGEYRGRGGLSAWVRVAALRERSNLRRDANTRARLESRSTAESAPPMDADLLLLSSKYKEEFAAAFREAFASLDAEDRLILRLHFVEGLTIERIASLVRGSRATIGRRLIAARGRLRDRSAEKLAARLVTTPSEVESVLAELRSHLEVSLSALLSRSAT